MSEEAIEHFILFLNSFHVGSLSLLIRDVMEEFVINYKFFHTHYMLDLLKTVMSQGRHSKIAKFFVHCNRNMSHWCGNAAL